MNDINLQQAEKFHNLNQYLKKLQNYNKWKHFGKNSVLFKAKIKK